MFFVCSSFSYVLLLVPGLAVHDGALRADLAELLALLGDFTGDPVAAGIMRAPARRRSAQHRGGPRPSRLAERARTLLESLGG
jgi:hypothetical protein